MRARAGVRLGVAAVCCAAVARGQDDPLVDVGARRSWGEGPARAFVATTVDVGLAYARVRATAGHGRPFTAWGGAEVSPSVTTSGVGVYGGLRLEVPHLDLRAGTRVFQAYFHPYLDPEPGYDRLDLETTAGDPAATVTYETEADVWMAVGPGRISLAGGLSLVAGVPDGMNVFEETLKVVVTPPLVVRGRTGYALLLGERQLHSVALAAELLAVPERDEAITARAGVATQIVLSRRLEVRASLLVPVASPDRLGLLGGGFSELGLRYRWATE